VFNDRFVGSLKPLGSRQKLSFEGRLIPLGSLKDEWGFIESETLRTNIASELQKVHFDVLFVNDYNVYYSPEAMTLKHAIIAVASVAEAVLEVAVKMIETEPRVRAIIETREHVFDEFHELSLTGVETPEGLRVVAGVQREVVRGKLDRNTKMDLLIRAAQAGGIVDEEMAKKLQQLRRFRNRVHIKTVEELEYTSYTHGVANAMINILEEFRISAKAWIEAKHAAVFAEALAALTPRTVAASNEVWPAADDDIPF
jgi:hypothetical protein